MLRSVYDDKRSAGSSKDKQFTRDLNELTQFVKAGRLHTVSLWRPCLVSRPLRTIWKKGLLNLTPRRIVHTLATVTSPYNLQTPSSFTLSYFIYRRLQPIDPPSIHLRRIQELLIRYNPLQGLSTEDRVTATAKRVGLSSPTGYVKGQEFGRGWAVKDESENGGENEEGGR